MQRAISFSKLVSSHHVALNQEVEIEHLTRLLPITMNTRLRVDVYQLLAQSRSRCWKLPLTPTLISDSNGLTVVASTHNDALQVTRTSSQEQAFQTFLTAAKQLQDRTTGPWPKFVHRADSRKPTFIGDFERAVYLWNSLSAEEQRLQVYISPPTTQLTLLRVHWKATKQRAVYYIVSNKKPAGIKQEIKLPFLAKRLPELVNPRASVTPLTFSTAYAVNIKSPAECWATKRLKPIPEINQAVAEIAKLLNFCTPHSKEVVHELVCDFVPDANRKWVFLACKGVHFQSKRKLVTQNYELKRKIDLKFILFPLFHQKQILGQRIREAKKSEELLLSTHARRISILGLTEKGRTEEPTANPSPEPQDIEVLESPSFSFARKSPSKGNPTSFNQVINDYDEMMGNIKRYKMELRGATDYLQRYGGIDFWAPIMNHVLEQLCEETSFSRFFSDMNTEEAHMMRRGVMRVLEGNYHLYYKQSLTRIHKPLGISPEQYLVFLNIMEHILNKITVTPHDCGIIMRRFVMLEGCIVSTEEAG